ncbi:hypothetical protein PR202_gb05414 [Eleusine coracana subsp. coracana]|uniref:Uncharacterized protein n=1 Tax=Eleusine coracana subsp. coracana TaxID=191504 RepID=A0AAV5E7V2_ELECO|nr:hypothetical protein PR202_gb05414 [Eleusine coracana subsp. coracana]
MAARRYERAVARDHAGAHSDDDDSDGEFEFPFVSRDDAAVGCGGAAPADELFAGGRIRAFYPVFGRVLDDAAPTTEPAEPPKAPLGRLFQLDKARTSSVASTSSSSSSGSSAAAGGDLDAASPDTYCLWTPGLSSSAASSPSRPPRKSGSTGSTSRWRRIGDLVVGRSHSDGREKFVFLSAPSSPARDHGSSSPANKAKKQQQARGGMSMSYGGASANKGGARRTFLPYRQDLVGLFANVQGLRRSHHHPF